MMTWYPELYIGDSIRGRIRRARQKLEAGRPVFGLYLVTYATSPHNELDILNATFLMQKMVRDRLPEIVGVAGSYEEALALVLQITEECLMATGEAHLADYLKEKVKKEL
ncbi:MAG: hypothetical protein Q4B73_04805 [Lachnospiraceae bacterium]|nr:hypothetical protein [Lachnospiraceae bacterium]